MEAFIPAKIVKVPIEIGGRRKIAEIAFDEVIFRESSREVELRW
jgi:hypothetical protein